MIAGDPELHVLPPAIALCIPADLSDSVIHDRQRTGHDGIALTSGVRCLVDTGECNERVPRSLRTQAIRGSLAYGAIDGEPTAYIAAKVGGRRPCDEARILPDSIAST